MNERSCQAVGIDLGTTYSSLAYLDAQQVARVVQDSSGQAVVPSVVFFDDQEIIVGDIAMQQAKLRSDRVVQFVKVHMGDEWRFTIDGQIHTPESISAIILAHLVREAEQQLGPVRTAVITVPAYFTEKRRRATQQAGEIAGLTVIGTLNEPMAAAIAYGLHRENKEQKILVYDLGGGTFDVTIVKVTPNELEELAICGNRQLGGKDWDECLINVILEDYQKKYGLDLRAENSPSAHQALQDLQLECERAKRRLSRMAKTAVRFTACGNEHICDLSRDQFEKLTNHLLENTRLTMQTALDDARLGWRDLSRIVLIGGSTHMPMVREMVRNACGFAPDTGINPVTAVALGAATYAQIVETGKGPFAVLAKETLDPEPFQAEPDPIPELLVPESELAELDDLAPALPPKLEEPSLPTVRFVTAHGVGIRAMNKGEWTNVVLIPKNTGVPAVASKQFFTRRRSEGVCQGRVAIRVTQGDTADPELAEHLGEAMITGLPSDEPGGQPISVSMRFDEQGRLHLEAIYLKTNLVLNMALQIPGALRGEDVMRYKQLMVESGLVKASHWPDIPMAEFDDDDSDNAPIPLRNR